jgi:transcriptional regulator with XRE-family HTH domain
MSATTLALNAPKSPIPIVIGYVIASLPVFGLQVGTGGTATPDYVTIRGTKGYGFPGTDLDGQVRTPKPDAVSPGEILAHIRAVLRANVTDLARALRVSRQAIYDWQAGRPMAADNIERLRDVARAADLFVSEGFEATAYLMRRPIAKGQNFFEIVRDGGSAESAARRLIEIARRELSQHEKMRSRLAGRAGPTREDFRDLGAPMLDEKG